MQKLFRILLLCAILSNTITPCFPEEADFSGEIARIPLAAPAIERPVLSSRAENAVRLRILHNGRPVRLVQNGRLRQKCRAALDGQGRPGVYCGHGKGAGEFSLRRFRFAFGCASRTTRKGASPALQAGPAPFSVPGQTPQALPGGRKKNRRGRNFVYDRRHFHH